MNDSLKRLTEKTELVDAIKGGGTTHQTAGTANGYNAPNPVLVMGTSTDDFAGASTDVEPTQIQRAFLQSAMAQNLKIQQQLLAQNQALQSLLSQQDVPGKGKSTTTTTSTTTITTKQEAFMQRGRTSVSSFNDDFDRSTRKSSSDSNSHIPPPPPPPMPPPIELNDPSAARPFLDPYGRYDTVKIFSIYLTYPLIAVHFFRFIDRAKTVRIGKWVWPPKDYIPGTEENFMAFKMRQNQRKHTPASANSSPNGSSAQIEWDEFDIDTSTPKVNEKAAPMQQRKFSQDNVPSSSASSSNAPITPVHVMKQRRSFEIGADRPPPGSVGKLKLSSEMRQRLEQVTAGKPIFLDGIIFFGFGF